jgi:hypothetical protein
MRILQIAACLLIAGFFSSCSSTSQTTGSRQTLEQRLMAKYAGTDMATQEPAPPAEGPNDVPADSPQQLDRNPALIPTPLLRESAASGL